MYEIVPAREKSIKQLFILQNSDTDMQYTHASLFSGIGGAELAASWLGWDNVFHCEIQEFQRKVLEYWFPKSISYEDITKTDFTEWRGRIDILTGGFPCQPFSVAGKRKGAEDNRYLWDEMLRAIRQIQPTWVVGENVAGILSMVQPGKEIKVGRADDLFNENFVYRAEQQFTIDAICEDLEREGYSVQPFVIPACAVGAPHRRDRVWIVAHRTDPGIEDLRKRQVDTDEPRAAADAPICGSVACKTDNTAERERRKDNGQQGERREPTKRTDGLHTFPFSVANTQCSGGGEMVKDVQSELADGTWTDGNGMFRTSSDANGQRRNALEHDNSGSEKPRKAESEFGRADCPQSWWRNFPTQSPVCRRNDGLPFRVADLTISFPKWRSKSIEALGNAWVPHVAYEIFKAIDSIKIRK